MKRGHEEISQQGPNKPYSDSIEVRRTRMSFIEGDKYKKSISYY